MVPYERNRFFVGRDTFIADLHNTFQSNTRPALQHHGRIALFGLGGIGKTQIALEFVYRSQSSYRRIYWISAATQESLLDGYQKIGKRANIPIAPDLKPVEVAEQVMLWPNHSAISPQSVRCWVCGFKGTRAAMGFVQTGRGVSQGEEWR